MKTVKAVKGWAWVTKRGRIWYVWMGKRSGYGGIRVEIRPLPKRGRRENS